MTSVFGRSRLFLGFVGLVSALATGVSAAPTVSLKVVAVNGNPVARSNSISINAGDTITAEIFASDWSPNGELLRGFQADISRASFLGGTRGSVTPLGWDRPPADDFQCRDGSVDCPAEFPVCTVPGGPGVCVGLDYTPALGLFIDTDRPDWVFNDPDTGRPLGGFAVVDFSSSSVRFGGIVINQFDSVSFVIPAKYCGTLKLQASGDACGTFSLRFPQGDTALLESSNVAIADLVRQGLAITVTSIPGDAAGACSCVNIVTADVPNCAIDARQPKNPDGSNPQTPNSVTFTFDCLDAAAIASTSNFSYSTTPGGFAPFLSSAVSSGNNVTVSLNAPMVEKKWNCFTFTPTGQRICLGIMPGDVDSDGSSFSFDSGVEGSDIDALVACLNAPGSCSLLQCDVNRSGACSPQDLLREIDMLIGAGTFTTYDTQGILSSGNPVACPSAP